MRPSRFSALLTAIVLSISMISCSDNNTDVPRIQRDRDKDKEFSIGQSYAADDEEIPDYTEIPDELCDISKIEEKVQLLMEHIDDKKDEAVIKDDIQSLLDMYDQLYEANTNMAIIFYSKYSDKDLEDEYNKFYRAASVAEDLLAYGFIYGYNSDYRQLFEELVDEDDIVKHADEYDLEDARLESEASFEDRAEALSSYYDITSKNDLSNKEKDLQCAEILLDLLNDYDTDMLYSLYDRDYTGDEIIALGDTVKAKLIPVNEKLVDAYFDTPNWASSYYSDNGGSDPFEVIREYAPLLSEDISKSAEIICNEKLYSICDNDEAFPGAFTDDMPIQNRAKIFIGNVGPENELSSAIHEFGHFHACLYKNNMDIAEIQSQGLELLFMQFYDDIYGDESDSKKIEKVMDLLDSVICGFLVGEFEYTVVRDKDKMTPEKVVELFNDIFKDYSPYYNLNMIPHLFESPGYYISYATSSLAAFDIFEDLQKDPKKAVAQYEKIAKTSFNSGEYTFKMALKKCGFSDVLTKEYISNLADELSDYAESF